MIRIGKLTDYAMLILSHMAKQPALLLSATSLAESLHLKVPTVSKILKILSDANLVTSTRGAEGGYRLAFAPKDISIVDVIAAMEGDFALTECGGENSQCAINTRCGLRENWRTINKMVHGMLAKWSILDMTQPISLQGFSDDK